MRGELGVEEGNEVGVHGGVVVGHAGDDEGWVGEFGGEAGGVFLLQAEDGAGLADVAGGQLDAGAVFPAGRAGRVARMGVEQGSALGASHRLRERRKRSLVFTGAAGGVGRQKNPASHEAGRAGRKSRDRV